MTTRSPVNAVLYAPPPRTGKRGRPRLKRQRLGIPAEIAATAHKDEPAFEDMLAKLRRTLVAV